MRRLSRLLAFVATGVWAAPTHVGTLVCAGCHEAQTTAWRQSHHAKSMQVAGPGTVLGDFRDIRLDHHGQATRFFRRGGGYWVRTAGKDGRPRDFLIAYTFGVYPLQQYLIAQPGGRLQALGIAWDARPRTEGGHRWFHLYANDPPKPGEPTHWTGRDQNWNFMCSECHSTGLNRNYDVSRDRYRTVWAEIDVACESCHGPGSAHVAWAKGPRSDRPAGLGLTTILPRAADLPFAFATPQQTIATAQRGSASAGILVNTCLGCHSRRQSLHDGAADPAAPYLDRYLPSLLDPGVFHVDGQVDGEVFEGASFLQSAMQRAGVTCSHCHEPHSAKLRAEGNGLCGQCHRADHYDRPEHHHHRPESAAAHCVECHMPGKVFMGVHLRRDHSLRVPRPDLSAKLGTPNACQQCHADKDAGWAAAAVAAWGVRPRPDAAAVALEAAWAGHPDSDALLAGLAVTAASPVKSSLLAALPPTGASRVVEAVAVAANDKDDWIRLGAARALRSLPPGEAVRIGTPLLDDPRLAVRIEAARALAGPPAGAMDSGQRTRLEAVADECIRAELASAERPEAHLNVALLAIDLGRLAQVESALRQSLRLAPEFVPALVNLADLRRRQGRDGDGERLLRRAVGLAPDRAEPAAALGLLLIRRGRRQEAVAWLGRAAALAPDDPRYAYALTAATQGNGIVSLRRNLLSK